MMLALFFCSFHKLFSPFMVTTWNWMNTDQNRQTFRKKGQVIKKQITSLLKQIHLYFCCLVLSLFRTGFSQDFPVLSLFPPVLSVSVQFYSRDFGATKSCRTELNAHDHHHKVVIISKITQYIYGYNINHHMHHHFQIAPFSQSSHTTKWKQHFQMYLLIFKKLSFGSPPSGLITNNNNKNTTKFKIWGKMSL